MATFNDHVTCPHCGTVTPAGECEAIEYVARTWRIAGRESMETVAAPDTLYFRAGSSRDDDGAGVHLACPSCYGFMPLPDGLTVEWV